MLSVTEARRVSSSIEGRVGVLPAILAGLSSVFEETQSRGGPLTQAPPLPTRRKLAGRPRHVGGSGGCDGQHCPRKLVGVDP